MAMEEPPAQQDADTIVVFTARSPERIIREGGSQAWVLNPVRAKQARWLVCTQNRHHPNLEFSDATEPHGSAFLVGKISKVVKSEDVDPADRNQNRWLIAISEFARIARPGTWDGSRNPVRYTCMKELGINPDELRFEPMPESEGTPGGTQQPRSQAPAVTSLTIADAKRALASTFGVDPTETRS